MSEHPIQKELLLGPKASIINIVNHLIEEAHHLRASDIHIDPQQDDLQVRFRIDGILQDVHTLPRNIHSEIISRIKIVSGIRTDEHHAAQDGRFRAVLKGAGPVDVRVSVIPTFYGENAVMRLLSDKAEEFTLETLGFSASNRKKITRAIQRSYGMILATGPTGSGKTTTLYTLIKNLNVRGTSIITIEEPVEYAIGGINQIQVNPRTGLTFANGLRSILRQDPNIIMVGEIRDVETAGIAVNTALTGHLLLSTLHTNDAATTLPRLLDMKLEPFLIASTVNIAIGQRLVRKICDDCKVEKKITEAEAKSLTEVLSANVVKKYDKFYEGKGCDECAQSGYRGRLGIHEVLVVDNAIREAVLKKVSAEEIKRVAIEQGMIPILEDGFEKAGAGLTTISEVLRILHE